MFRSIGGATKGGDEAGEGGVAHRNLSGYYHRKCQPVFLERWKKNFNGRYFFFVVFYCAGQSENSDLGARPPAMCREKT
jgi:hypothetical protein